MAAGVRPRRRDKETDTSARGGAPGSFLTLNLIIAEGKTDPRFTVHTLIGPATRHNPRNTNLAQIAYCDDLILQPFPVELSTTP